MRTFINGWKIFLFSWRANGWLSLLPLLSSVYNDTLYPLFNLFLLAKIIDFAATKGITKISDLYFFGILIIFAYLLGIIIGNTSSAQAPLIEFEFESYMDIMIAKKLSEVDPATFENPEFQNLIAQLEGIIGGFYNSLSRSIGLVNSAVKVITASIVIGSYFPFLIPILILSTIPYYLAYDSLRETTWPFFGSERAPLLRIIRYIRSLLSSDGTAKEIAIYQTGPVLVSKLKTERRSFLRRFTKSVNQSSLFLIWSNLFQLITFIVTQYIILLSVFAKRISIGQYSLLFQQTNVLIFGSEQVLSLYSSMSMRNKFMEVFEEFMHTRPSITNPVHPVLIVDTSKPPKIEFKNVNFHYPGSKRFILKNFTLTIDPGEKVAFVGENGAGKSTLIKLLLRFYDVTDGAILINSIDIKELNQFEYRSMIGALFQDFIKYQFTFKENVYFGNLREKSNTTLLDFAILKSGAKEYLDQLPKGIDQVVGKMFENGVDLSGGQWQKLALARAFFRDAPILILDEPTSAIDAKAEYEIFERVQKLQKDKTVIIISHRFSTVRNADKIVVLNNGKVIEEGNHEYLIKKKGLYNELFTIQAKGYK